MANFQRRERRFLLSLGPQREQHLIDRKQNVFNVVDEICLWGGSPANGGE